MKTYEELKKILPKLEKDVPLKSFTTFKIGGPARFFYRARSKDELVKVLKTAKEENIPYFILGGGSNILVSDEGFSGIVIKAENDRVKMEGRKITAGAGTNLRRLAIFTTHKGLSDLEWAGGIPGTLAGAVRGNAAAFGGSMDQVVTKVTAFDPERNKVLTFGKGFEFGNKESIFKKNDLVILEVELELEKGDRKEGMEKLQEYVRYKKEHHPMKDPSAGCIFKNYKGRIEDPRLLKKFPLLKKFNEKGVIPTGYLIDKASLRGKEKGGAKISEKHSNFIINKGDAKASDVLALSRLAKEKVKEVFGVDIEEEVIFLGF